jgi:GldM N-terminal domain.
MALPKEPRQKMINVMYLVLTALLALNVSSEVLNAFRTMDKSFSNASAVIDNKTNTIFSSFESKLKDPKTSELASIWKPKADKAKQLSDELVAYIEDLKTKIKNEAGSSGDHFNEKKHQCANENYGG